MGAAHPAKNTDAFLSVQQRRNVLSKFTHAWLSAGSEWSSRWTMVGQWRERLLGEIVNSDGPHVEQLGEVSRWNGYAPRHNTHGHRASK